MQERLIKFKTSSSTGKNSLSSYPTNNDLYNDPICPKSFSGDDVFMPKKKKLRYVSCESFPSMVSHSSPVPQANTVEESISNMSNLNQRIDEHWRAAKVPTYEETFGKTMIVSPEEAGSTESNNSYDLSKILRAPIVEFDPFYELCSKVDRNQGHKMKQWDQSLDEFSSTTKHEIAPTNKDEFEQDLEVESFIEYFLKGV